jgi:uncharacterized protein with PQ loop repeat
MKLWPLSFSNTTCFRLAIAAFLVIAWLFHSWNWDLLQAVVGFSPITYVMEMLYPENFAHDFPLGVSITDASSFMHIYKYLYMIFGLSPAVTGYGVIFLEMVLLSIGFYYFCKSVRPDMSRTAYFIVILLVVGSNARDINLAYFGYPYFEGQYYNAADFFRLSAFACIITRRYILAGLCIGLCFTVHPILAAMSGVFMGAMILAAPQALKDVKLWLGGALALFIAGVWSFFYLGMGNGINAELQSIPHEDWFLFTQLTSHWYPINIGGFDAGAPNKLLPFLSFVILFVHYLGQRKPFNTTDRAIFYGVLAAALMIILGAVFSLQREYPLLVKICLLRASDLVVMAGLPYVVLGLLHDIQNKSLFYAAFAFGLLITPFVDTVYAGWHGALTFVVILPALMKSLKTQQKMDFVLWSVCFLYIACALNFLLHSSVRNVHLSVYYADDLMAFLTLPLIASAAVFMLLKKKGLSKFLVSAVCLILSLTWLWKDIDFRADDLNNYAQDYKEVQLWAKNNTAKDALVMVEPSIAYGWRAYSQRSSFGTPREHYLMSWIYNGDVNAFNEGQKRLAIYDMDVRHIIAEHPIAPATVISDKASNEFNAISRDEFHLRVIASYGVDYFVFEKSRLKQAYDTKKWQAMYENAHFIVLQREHFDE